MEPSHLLSGRRAVAAAGVVTGLVLAGLGAAQPRAAAPTAEAVRDQLRVRLEHSLPGRWASVDEERVHASRVLPAFYERRLYLPVWSSGGRPTGAATELLSVIGGVGSEGLEPEDYHLGALSELRASAEAGGGAATLADFDLLMTDAFLILGAHLVSGRVDPETFDAEWVAHRREVDLAETLERALAGDGPRRTLDDLRPRHVEYRRLADALATYRGLAEAGGWPSVPDGPVLRPGESSLRVRDLRARLGSGDPRATRAPADPLLYDEELETAVIAFQASHGLDTDGVVGDKTLAALNVPADVRARQIELNLERWRWLPQKLGERYVVVNIPAFDVSVIEGDEVILEMRVAVGRSYRRTPVFSDAIRYLVLNPHWEVPHRLAVQDKLPEIKKDPEFLSREGFRVYQGWGAEQREIDPATVDWSDVEPRSFSYRLRQSPGPRNALGRVKFMFPNRFNVYLHDTPSREVFGKAERDVSSGCIRLERPLELAETLLGPESRWSRSEIERVLASGAETVISLERPVPVHLLYWTAWADADGAIHFRNDVYGRDALLAEALERAAEAARRGDPGS
jgi:murein L,D-transpeptidase YcbB/YkuD